ncbi:MAG: acyl-CoA thioesterase domain-containing protein [Ideonella sp.]
MNANPAEHMERVPFASTLGLVWEGGADRTARVRLPMNGAAASLDGLAVDPLALLALLDHSCSAAVYLALPRPSLIATIDLRCEFAHRSEPGADVICSATTQYLDENFALVRATALSGTTGQCLVYSSSTYSIGAHPGMAGKQVSAEAWLQAGIRREPQQSFRGMLSLYEEGSDFVLPFHEQLIGAVSLPAVHGGATAASLALAAVTLAERTIDPASSWSPLSVTVHYLRAVKAHALTVRPVLRKPGARSCVVGASAFQDTGKESAHAECLLIRNP